MDIQKVNQNIDSSIAKQVYQINQLIPYPLTDIQIEDVSKSLSELLPELNSEDLKTIIDRFKMNHYEWDRTKVIQNIFKYAPEVLKTRLDEEAYKKMIIRLKPSRVMPPR